MKPVEPAFQSMFPSSRTTAVDVELSRIARDSLNSGRLLVAADYIARDGTMHLWNANGADYIDDKPGNVFTHPGWLRAYEKQKLLIVGALREGTDAPRLVFSREGGGLLHQGRLLRLDVGLIESLTKRLMARDADAAFVVFEDVELPAPPKARRNQHVFHYQNNWRLPLREASKRMSKLLVKSTRRKARGLSRDISDLRITFEAAPNQSLLDSIARFGRKRMKALRKRYGIDRKEITRLGKAAVEVGHATVVRNRDSVLAAELIFIAGDQAYSSTHGYDSRYAKSSLGMITLINSIEACAARGIKDFNMLWGDQPYKRHFGADCIKLHTVIIRGSARAFLNAGYLRAVAYYGWRDAKRRLRPLAKLLRLQRH